MSCQYPHSIPKKYENMIYCEFKICKNPYCTDFHTDKKRQIPSCDPQTCIGLACRFAHVSAPIYDHDCIYYPCRNPMCLSFHEEGQQLFYPCSNLNCLTKKYLDREFEDTNYKYRKDIEKLENYPVKKKRKM
jgi:hypothetical protein